jgi:hypothetical protein
LPLREAAASRKGKRRKLVFSSLKSYIKNVGAYMIAVKSETETIENCAYGDDCPLHAENPPFNAKVLAAIAESRAIMLKRIPAKKYNSLEEARKDLGV